MFQVMAKGPTDQFLSSNERVVSTCCLCRRILIEFLLHGQWIPFEFCNPGARGGVEGTVGQDTWSASSPFCLWSTRVLFALSGHCTRDKPGPFLRGQPPCLDMPILPCWLSAWWQELQGLFPILQRRALSICVFLDFAAPFAHVDHSLPETRSFLGFCRRPLWLAFCLHSNFLLGAPFSSTCCLPQESVLGVPLTHTLSPLVSSSGPELVPRTLGLQC